MKKSIYLLLTFFIIHSSFCYAQKQGHALIDSLLQELPKAKEDTNKVNLLTNLSSEYYSSNPDEGIKYGEMGLNLAEQLNWKKGIANLSNNLGTCNWSKSNYPKALEYLFKALKINEELNNKKGIARNFGNIGGIYMNQSDYPKALEYLFKALKINEALNRKEGISRNLGNIGILYMYQSDYPKALEYYFKALKIEEELNNKNGIASNLTCIGIIYMEQSDYPKALEYYFKALKISEELNDKRGIAYNLADMGELYIKLSQDTIYDKIQERNEFIGLTKEINLKKGIEYSLSAEKICKEINDLNLLIIVSQNLYKGYKRQGNYLKALEYHEQYKTMQDSVFNMDKAKKIATLEAKREIQLKEKEIEVLNKDKQYQGVVRNSLFGGIVLLLCLAVLLYLFFRRKNRDNKKLAEKNVLITEQKEVIEEKNKNITSSINYAKRIQDAILPFDTRFKAAFPESFILYLPQAIVSGDFYWLSQTDEEIIFAVADCTGHGVPGAFMSLIGNDLLNHLINEEKMTDTAKILEELHIGIRKSLKQESDESTQMDGMDIGLIKYITNKETKTKTIEFAGANRPLFYSNGNNSIMEIKGDRKTIGGRQREEYRTFTKHFLEFQENEKLTMYMTTDGFTDQNNERDEKYGSRKLKELLERISGKNISEQKQLIEENLNQFKGNVVQRDDITIVGIKC